MCVPRYRACDIPQLDGKPHCIIPSEGKEVAIELKSNLH